MLILLSNLNLVTRIEVSGVSTTVQDTMLQGFWLTPAGAKFAPAVSGHLPGQGFQIWTESNRSMEASWETGASSSKDNIGSLGAGHFSPDATDKTQLTVLYGKYRALTNVFAGAPAAGQALYVNSDGLLAADATWDKDDNYLPVAICTKAKDDTTHIGKTYSCIEYVTL